MVPSGSLAVALNRITAGAVYEALFTGFRRVIAGGSFFTTPFTSTVRALEVVVRPLLSVALAVSEYVPAGTFLQVKLKGDDDLLFSKVPPLKNSTLLMGPSASDAVALIVIVAGSLYVELLFGDVIATTGGVPVLVITDTNATFEVDTRPLLSVALAEIE